jgi:hypothetical protein
MKNKLLKIFKKPKNSPIDDSTIKEVEKNIKDVKKYKTKKRKEKKIEDLDYKNPFM